MGMVMQVVVIAVEATLYSGLQNEEREKNQ